MRPVRWVVLILLVLALAAVLVIASLVEILGDGRFEQVVVVDADVPVRRVTYCDYWVDAEVRTLAESTADPRLFDCKEARPLGGGRFSTTVRFASRTSLLGGDRVSHPPQLVVYVEYEGGGRACRVIDVPLGMGKQEAVVSLR